MTANGLSNSKELGQTFGPLAKRVAQYAEEIAQIKADWKEDVKAFADAHEIKVSLVNKALKRYLDIEKRGWQTIESEDETVDMLLAALGDFANLPLGQSAVDRAEAKRGDGKAF